MYKKVNVVMLATNDKAHFGNIILIPNTKKLLIFEHQNCTEVAQHLYITSDEEIKNDDWFLTNQNGHWELQKCQKICDDGIIMSFEEEIAMFQEDTYFVFKPENSKKIIATTDTSLIKNISRPLGVIQELPQPSQQFIQYFIKEYNKGNIITKVLVEYEIWDKFTNVNNPIDHTVKKVEELKVNPDNIINIKPIKDSWSREEVIKIPDILFEKYFNDYFLELFNKNLKSKHLPFSKSNTFKKWIEENL